jgi:predicted MFS family arabinose efflux permease
VASTGGRSEVSTQRSGAGGGTGRVTVAVAAALTAAVLPVFLVGAASDAIRADLGLGETAIGAAVTVVFVSVGLTAATVGRLTERLGATAALRTGVLVSAGAAVLIGSFATSWWLLAAPLVLVGIAIGLVDTGGARAFADRLATDHQGAAFGIKEASVPSASLLAGLALPTLVVWLDWRASFLAAPAIALLVLVLLPRRPAPDPPAAHRETAWPDPATTREADAVTSPDPVARRRLLRFAVGVGLGSGAATAAATFLVPASTARGLSITGAGVLLVVASLASIGARIGLGRWADRDGAVPTRAVAACCIAGGVGVELLAAPVPAPVVALASVLLLGAGWGWTGLAFLAAVRARPDAPAVAAGTVLTGLGAGGAAGPIGFGALAGTWSYAVAWAAAATCLLAAGALAASATPARQATVPR